MEGDSTMRAPDLCKEAGDGVGITRPTVCQPQRLGLKHYFLLKEKYKKQKNRGFRVQFMCNVYFYTWYTYLTNQMPGRNTEVCYTRTRSSTP